MVFSGGGVLPDNSSRVTVSTRPLWRVRGRRVPSAGDKRRHGRDTRPPTRASPSHKTRGQHSDSYPVLPGAGVGDRSQNFSASVSHHETPDRRQFLANIDNRFQRSEFCNPLITFCLQENLSPSSIFSPTRWNYFKSPTVTYRYQITLLPPYFFI